MRSIIYTVGLLLFAVIKLSAQEISSQLIDAKTQQPIPYATIEYAKGKGVISNEEGLFSFILDENTQLLDSIYISSMGYQKIGYTLEQLQDSILVVSPKAIELSGVYLFDKELEVDEIIETAIEKIPSNYNKIPTKQHFFLRKSFINDIHKFDIGFKKSTIKELTKELMDSIVNITPKHTEYYTETLGHYYKSGEHTKLTITKAAKMYDKENEGSIEALSTKMEKIFKDNVKPDSYLKIKSGIIGTKVQLDSVITAEGEVGEELEKEIEKESEENYFLEDQKGTLDWLTRENLMDKDWKLNVLTKPNKYEFTLKGYADIDDAGVYVVDFSPKRGNYKGTLYINIEDFAIMRMDYQNTARLSNIKLLGFAYQKHTFRGSILFKKMANGKYDIRFMEKVLGEKFGVDRPLKVIEKNKHVKGRRKQNELSLNIDVVSNQFEKFEWVVFDETEVSEEKVKNLKEDKTTEATYMPAYNPEFWKGYTIMEPNAAIRAFEVQ